ncbi:hypothetical protein [Mycobacterium sp.]|uniref:hypothetical protein n=1 Tax=Mycobacterium sp. TaxID=1785 RepID=UPI003F96C63E
MVSDSVQLLILKRIIRYSDSGAAQLSRINLVAPSDGTRQHNQASDALTFRNHFRFVALRFFP